MNIKYGVTGNDRKALAQALAALNNCEATYQGAPTFNYIVGDYAIDKDGTIICPDSAAPNTVHQLIEDLGVKGYKPTSADLDTLTVELPISLFTEEDRDRLDQLISSKETILKKALGATSLQIEESEGKLRFPWFTLHGIDGEAKAYSQLISALGKMAREQKRITAKDKPSDNDKFTMRLFLIRLGFIGDEYKIARKLLTKNLPGNSSWRSGTAHKRIDPAETKAVNLKSESSAKEGENENAEEPNTKSGDN